MSLNHLQVIRVDKGNVNVRTLIPIIEIDKDFVDNEEQFRSDTIKLGFKNEAERVSKEIFLDIEPINGEEEDENYFLKRMLDELFSGNVNNFLFGSSICDSYMYVLTETEFEYIISFSYSIKD